MNNQLVTGPKGMAAQEPEVLEIRAASPSLTSFAEAQTETLRHVNSHRVAQRLEETRWAIYNDVLDKRKVVKSGLLKVRELRDPWAMKAAQEYGSKALGILHGQVKEYVKLANGEKVHLVSPPRVDATGFREAVLRGANIERA